MSKFPILFLSLLLPLASARAAPLTGYEPRLRRGEYTMTLTSADPVLANILKGTVGLTIEGVRAAGDYAGTFTVTSPRLGFETGNGRSSVDLWAAAGNELIQFEIQGLAYDAQAEPYRNRYDGHVMKEGKVLANFHLEPVPAPVPSPDPGGGSPDDCGAGCAPNDVRCIIHSCGW